VIDYSSPLPRLHSGYGLRAHRDGRQAVQLERARILLGIRDVGEPSRGRSTRVRHEDVEATERVTSGAYERRRSLGGPDVSNERDHVAVAGRPFDSPTLAPTDRDVDAFGRECLRDREAQSA
jgi:hypothetical protein